MSDPDRSPGCTTNPAIVCVTDPDSPEFLAAMQVYRQTFAKALRDDESDIADYLRYPDRRRPFHLLVYRENDTVIGFAMGEYVADEKLGFLAYIGTSPRLQSKGVGTTLYLAFLEKCVEDGLRLTGELPEGIVMEAERPAHWASAEEQALCAKRLAFYHRLGADPVPLSEYRMPVAGSGYRSFHLLYHPIGRVVKNDRQARQLGCRVLGKVYGIRKPQRWVS